MEKEKVIPEVLKCFNCNKEVRYEVNPNYCVSCGWIFIADDRSSLEKTEIAREFWDKQNELVSRYKDDERTNEFGNTLRQLRQSMGITQLQLATQLNMTEANVSSYERGKSIPPTYILQMIGDIFDVSVDSLLGRTAEQEETTVETVVDGTNNGVSPFSVKQALNFKSHDDVTASLISEIVSILGSKGMTVDYALTILQLSQEAIKKGTIMYSRYEA